MKKSGTKTGKKNTFVPSLNKCAKAGYSGCKNDENTMDDEKFTRTAAGKHTYGSSLAILKAI